MLVLLSVPLIELFVIVQVSGSIGGWQTIGLVVLVSVVGAWLVRRSGLGVWAQMRAKLAQGQLPAKELVEGVLILIAGALMLTPGFLTDAIGLLLLFPPTRVLVRAWLIGRFKSKVTPISWPPGAGFGARQRDVFDVRGNPSGDDHLNHPQGRNSRGRGSPGP